MKKMKASKIPGRKPWDTYRACEVVEGVYGPEHSREEIVEAVQYLIDTRAIFSLQGMYGRLAAHLIESGDCKVPVD
jgi:hypothetical protein